MDENELIYTGQGEQQNIPRGLDTAAANDLLSEARSNAATKVGPSIGKYGTGAGAKPVSQKQSAKEQRRAANEAFVSGASARVKNMITSPDFHGDNGMFDTNQIEKRSNVAFRPELVANVMNPDVAYRQDFTSDTGTIIKDSAKMFGMSLLTLGDKAMLGLGAITSKATGGELGTELRDRAYESLEAAAYNMNLVPAEVGDVETWTSKITMGASSLLEMAAVGMMTGGIAPLAQMSVEVFGDGTYNNMRKYAEENDGSIDGYEGNWAEIGIDLTNAAIQTAIERYLGFGSSRWLRGTAGHFAKEAAEGFLQESSQEFMGDFGEVLKGNEELSILAQNWKDYLTAGIIGGVLQGALGAAVYKNGRLKADDAAMKIYQKVKKANDPAYDETDPKNQQEARAAAKQMNDKIEAGMAAEGMNELFMRADANNDRGKVRDNIVGELTKVEVSRRGLKSAEELTPEQLADIQDAATIMAREAVRMSWAQGIPILETAPARMYAEGNSLRVRDFKDSDRGVQVRRTEDIEAMRAKVAEEERQMNKLLSRQPLGGRTQAERVQTIKERKATTTAKAPKELENEPLSSIGNKSQIWNQFMQMMSDGLKLDTWDYVKYSSLLGAGDTYQKGKRSKPATIKDGEKFAEKMIEKYGKTETQEEKPATKTQPKQVQQQVTAQEQDVASMTDEELVAKSKPSSLDEIENRQKELREEVKRLKKSGTEQEINSFHSAHDTDSVYVFVRQDPKYGTEHRFVKLDKYGDIITTNQYDNKNYNTHKGNEVEIERLRRYLSDSSVYSVPVNLFEQRADALEHRDFAWHFEEDVDLQQSLRGKATDSGRGSYNPRYQEIILNKDADISTILHESAHMWLNTYFKAARSESAPKEFKEWWGKVERALGIRPQDKFLDKDISEKFARSFEKFILDGGKGAMPTMRPVYDRLSKKLADIYDDLSTKYFDMVGDLKPEVQAWFAQNEKFADSLTGENREKERADAMKQAEREDKIETSTQGALETISDALEERSVNPYETGRTFERKLSVRESKKFGTPVETAQQENQIQMQKDAEQVVQTDVGVEFALQVLSSKGATRPMTPIRDGSWYNALMNKARDTGDYELYERIKATGFRPETATEMGRNVAALRNYTKAEGEIDAIRALDTIDGLYAKLNTKEQASLNEEIAKAESLVEKHDKMRDNEIDKTFKSLLECKL